MTGVFAVLALVGVFLAVTIPIGAHEKHRNDAVLARCDDYGGVFRYQRDGGRIVSVWCQNGSHR